MIKQVRIKNFLSHKNTVIDFVNGVNIIVGATDAGKSALVKAIRWVTLNKPTGAKFRRTGTSKTEVSIAVDNYIITRTRTKSTNTYSMSEIDGVLTQEFTAWQGDVPDEIKEVLCLSSVSVHSQFDPHFLLGWSPGKVAAHLNEVAHLEKIDLGIQSLNKSIKEYGYAITQKETEIDEHSEALKQFSNIVLLEKLTSDYEQLELDLKGMTDQIQSLWDTVVSISEVENQIIKTKPKTKALKLINEALSLSKRIEESVIEASRFSNLIEQLLGYDIRMKNEAHMISMEEPIDQVLKTKKQCDKAEKQADKLQAAIKAVSLVSSEHKRISEELGQLEELFHKNKGEVCPICDQKIA